jgi:oligoendopeptidase F
MTAMTKMYEPSGWSLDDLFPSHDAAEMKAAFAELDALAAEIDGRRNTLSADIPLDAFLDIIRLMERLNYAAYKVFGFAGLWFQADNQNQTAQAFVAKVQQLLAELQNRTLFFELWWKELADQRAGELLAQAGEYRYWLEGMRKMKPHTLTEAEEKVINIKNVTGFSALDRLYDTITSRYTFEIEVDGEVHKELSRDGLMKFAFHPNPEVRERAFRIMYAKYSDEAPVLGQIYQTIVRDWHNENVDLRHFKSPISVRNLRNDIPDEVVEVLLNVAGKNAGIFQRYFRLKAQWLGMEKIRRFDIYAPIANSDKQFSFGEAADMTFAAFRDFEPRIAELAQRVFDENHMDSEMRKGKGGGAFCWGPVPDITPWVLINYTGRARDVATLAHELGHAIHAMLAAHHNMFNASATLPLAETASTFGEILLIDYLLAREEDEAVRRDILFRQMDDSYAVIIRQIFFALFERQAHQMIKEDASTEELAAAYLENLRTQFGDSVDVDEIFKWEWVAIPHIFGTPFYVYAYGFGQLLVLALYQQFKAEGEGFKPRYLEILAAGGSAAPVEILSRAGIDVTRAEFWQGGFDVLAGMLAKLEAIPRG